MVYAPIWKDTFYTSTAETLSYSVKDSGGNTLYLGKAVKLPGAVSLELNMNQICRTYMNNDIPESLLNATVATSATNSDACKVFNLYSASTLLESYTFLWNWSYLDWNGGSVSMSLPVNGHNNGKMLTFSSAVASSVVTNSVSFNNNGYCGDWALYYQNSLGGWDSFLIEGNVKRTDTVTQYKYSKSAKNTSRDFEDITYTEDIDRRWQLYTGWLTDAQASNIADNLLQSPRVYAHNMVTNQIFPVVITDTAIEHKTYKNQGHKPFNYVINIKASQLNIRR